MASCASKPMRNNSLIHKHPPKRSVLLKDYLRDDLSSCSSNGFKSFPRRQCCSTVGFFLEKDLQRQRKRRKTLPPRRSSSYSWALQRASGAIMNAIKWLPLSQKSGKAKKGGSGFVSRSLSRKLLSRSFWRKAVRKEGSEGVPRRRRSFRELIMHDQEHRKTTSLNEDNSAHAPSVTTSSGCGGDSWGDSEFTFASSESSNENYLVLDCTREPATRLKIDQVLTKEYWLNEKEQFSPVSILDCPFEDEEEIYKSHLKSTSAALSSSEGSKRKHLQKRRHLKGLASLEPVDLEKRFGRLELEDEPHNHSKKQRSPVLVQKKRTQNGDSNLRGDKNHNIEDNARDLLNLVKRSIPPNSLIIKAENLLFDFFKQTIIGESKEIDGSKKIQLYRVAKDWIHGQPQEQYLGWKVQSGRGVYVKEMDKCGEWKNCDQEIQQLGQDFANEVLQDLVDDLVLDLTTRASH